MNGRVCNAPLSRRHRRGQCQAVRSAPSRGGSSLRRVTDPRPVPPAPLPHSRCSRPARQEQRRRRPGVVYLLVNADGEDIPVPQRLLAQHQAVVELLDRLVALGGSVRVGQADKLSAPRMQLRRHLQRAASVFATVGGLRQHRPDLRQSRTSDTIGPHHTPRSARLTVTTIITFISY